MLNPRILFHNVGIIQDNKALVAKLKEGKPTKQNNLLIYLLGGRPVTGATMIVKFNIYSYRDAIYDLRKKGYNIISKTITAKNGVNHELWWLADFDEEFIKSREEKVF